MNTTLKTAIALGITTALTSTVYAESCKDIGVLSNDCHVPWERMEHSGTRADSDMAYATFKASYLGTLGTEEMDGIVTSLVDVIAERGTTVVHSFDVDPASDTGFSSASSSAKGFYASPSFSSRDCTVTFGTVDPTPGNEIDEGTAGSVTCPASSESTKFGTPPATYTIEYIDATMTALAWPAADFDVFVTQLFLAMAAQSLEATPGGVIIGDAVTGGVFGIFKISPTTGNWSFSGTIGKQVYNPDA